MDEKIAVPAVTLRKHAVVAFEEMMDKETNDPRTQRAIEAVLRDVPRDMENRGQLVSFDASLASCLAAKGWNKDYTTGLSSMLRHQHKWD